VTFSIVGHDVSYYQGAIDFQYMKSTGARFVILRVGYKNVEDVLFDTYMKNVAGVLPFAVYHFYDPLVHPVTQANAIIQSLAQYNYTGRVWLDFEFEWAGAYSASTNWKIYRDTLNAAGYTTGIYTRATWWNSRVGNLAADFGRDPFWVAQYSSALALIPKGASTILIWQSGSPTYNAGQSSPRIDYDLWNDQYNFDAEWGTVTPPIGEPMTETWKVLTSLKVRSGPGTSYGQTQGLNAGDLIEGVYDIATQWIHISKIIRVNSTVIVFDGWCSGLPAYVEKITVTPPPSTIALPIMPVTITMGDGVTYVKQTTTILLQPLK
jgi:hypothetical protein